MTIRLCQNHANAYNNRALFFKFMGTTFPGIAEALKACKLKLSTLIWAKGKKAIALIRPNSDWQF